MKSWVILTLLLGCAAMAGAQETNGMQCTFNAGVTPTVRLEGISELIGDIVLRCNGGQITPNGIAVPRYNVTLTLNTQVTSRLLSDFSTDAALLIDEPGSSTNPFQQRACPNLFGCSVPGTGTGIVYNGINVPNVYKSQQSNTNQLVWLGVPIDAPGTVGVRVIRMLNVRANAAQLGAGLGGGLLPQQIMANISISGPNPVFIANPQQVVGFIQAGLSFNVQGTSFVQSGNSNFTAPGGGAALINFQYREGFPGAFKKRSKAASATNPFGDGIFNGLGQVFDTESGWEPFPATGLPPGVGSADSGTLLHLSLMTAAGCRGSVPLQNGLTSTSVAAAGNAVAIPVFGSATGGNVIVPAAPDGSMEFFFMVSEAASTPAATKTLNVPVTLNCSLPTLPFTIGGLGNFAPAQFTPSILFDPRSDSAPGIPGFAGHSVEGILLSGGQPVPAATVRDAAGSASPALNRYGSPVDFSGLTFGPAFGNQSADQAAASNDLVVPPEISFGVVSPGAPVSNVAVAKDAAASWLTVTLNQTTTPITATAKVDPTLAPGTYTANVTFSSPSAPANLVVPVTYTVQTPPFFTRWGFAQAGSYVNNVVAPGQPFVIFGYNFGPATLAGPSLGPDGRVTTTTGDTQVLFDGIPAPMYYSVGANGSGQTAGFAPFALDGKTSTKVQVVYKGVASPAVTIPVLDAVPALFTSDQSGGGQGAILNQNLTINLPTNPESPGNVVALYGGGAGQTTPSGRDGALGGVDGPLGQFKLPVKVFIDGAQIAPADVLYAAQAPGLVEGVFQINVRIPPNARHPANLPVIVQIGDKQTQPGVTIAVK